MSLKQFFDENTKLSQTVQEEDAFEKYAKKYGPERAQGYLDALEEVTGQFNDWFLNGFDRHECQKLITRKFTLFDRAKLLISKLFPGQKSEPKP